MDTMDSILHLSKKFIAIKSIAGNSKELEEILELALFDLKEFCIERFEKNGVTSVLVYNTNKRPKKFNLILNGHLDVIPGKEYQYKPRVIGDKLYGIGSMDMKANVICLIMAFKEVAKKVNYPLALQLVTDEQTGSLYGTKYQVEEGIRANFVIAGETTNFDIVNEAKGVLWIKISATGKTAHSAYPWQGKNAIWKMHELLNKLKGKYPIPNSGVWKTTVNVSYIKTNNQSFNKIPDDCEIGIDVRYIPGDKIEFINQLKVLSSKKFKLEIAFEEPPLLVDKNNKYVRALRTSAAEILKREISFHNAHGTSDATYYTRVGCPAVEFGPIGAIGHTNEEYINIPSLKLYFQILKRFLLSLR